VLYRCLLILGYYLSTIKRFRKASLW